MSWKNLPVGWEGGLPPGQLIRFVPGVEFRLKLSLDLGCLLHEGPQLLTGEAFVEELASSFLGEVFPEHNLKHHLELLEDWACRVSRSQGREGALGLRGHRGKVPSPPAKRKGKAVKEKGGIAGKEKLPSRSALKRGRGGDGTEKVTRSATSRVARSRPDARAPVGAIDGWLWGVPDPSGRSTLERKYKGAGGSEELGAYSSAPTPVAPPPAPNKTSVARGRMYPCTPSAAAEQSELNT